MNSVEGVLCCILKWVLQLLCLPSSFDQAAVKVAKYTVLYLYILI